MYLGQFNDHAMTAQRMRERMRKSGTTLDGKPLWTAAEDAHCRQHYPDYTAMRVALPHRTHIALLNRCIHLGLTKKSPHYTGREIKLFRTQFLSKDIRTFAEQLPERTIRGIEAQALKLGLRRSKPPYQSTGNYLLDALRTHCDAEDYRMADLDEFARCHYFRRRGWHSKKGSINYKHIVRAIHELGGRLRIEWSDQS